jgi:hypothetical protein
MPKPTSALSTIVSLFDCCHSWSHFNKKHSTKMTQELVKWDDSNRDRTAGTGLEAPESSMVCFGLTTA